MPPGAEPPQLLGEDSLRQLAEAKVLEHVAQVLTGEYTVETRHGRTAWDASLLRHVYDHLAVVWRKAMTVDVLFDAAGNIAGFVDEEKLVGLAPAPLSDHEALALAHACEPVERDWALVERSDQPSGLVELFLATGAKPSRKFRVRLNPARGAVVSVEPIE